MACSDRTTKSIRNDNPEAFALNTSYVNIITLALLAVSLCQRLSVLSENDLLQIQLICAVVCCCLLLPACYEITRSPQIYDNISLIC